MSSNTSTENLIPQLDGKALDFIKIIAAALMVIDHIGAFFFDSSVLWMYLLGRSVFPLFCYAVAMAALRAPDKVKDYAWKLLVLAIFVEPVSQFTRHADGAHTMVSVIFTLAAGAALIPLALKMEHLQVRLLFVLAMLLMPVLMPTMEFGPVGIFIPSCIVLFLRGEKDMLYYLLGMLFTVNMDVVGYIRDPVDMYLLGAFVMFCAATLLPWGVLQLATNLQGTGRFLHRYALHVFYPGHIFLLWLIKNFSA